MSKVIRIIICVLLLLSLLTTTACTMDFWDWWFGKTGSDALEYQAKYEQMVEFGEIGPHPKQQPLEELIIDVTAIVFNLLQDPGGGASYSPGSPRK